MANQHKSALQHAADELRPELERWGIEVLTNEIRWKNQALEVMPYTTKPKCKAEIRKMIALAEEDDQVKQLEKQGKLL